MEFHSPSKEHLGDDAATHIERTVMQHDRASYISYLCAALLFIAVLVVLVF